MNGGPVSGSAVVTTETPILWTHHMQMSPLFRVMYDAYYITYLVRLSVPIFLPMNIQIDISVFSYSECKYLLWKGVFDGTGVESLRQFTNWCIVFTSDKFLLPKKRSFYYSVKCRVSHQSILAMFIHRVDQLQHWHLYKLMRDYQGPDLYAFIGFIGPDDEDLNWLLILIFDYFNTYNLYHRTYKSYKSYKCI